MAALDEGILLEQGPLGVVEVDLRGQGEAGLLNPLLGVRAEGREAGRR